VDGKKIPLLRRVDLIFSFFSLRRQIIFRFAVQKKFETLDEFSL
jgi:hypothetical protein